MFKPMLNVKLLDARATSPTVAHPGEDLAYDIYALEDTTLLPLQPLKVRTGISAVFTGDAGTDRNYGLLIRDRSSMAAKGIAALAGVIDSGYRGEILVIMVLVADRSAASYTIHAGDKIAQMVPVPVLTSGGVQILTELPHARRGDRGFGSSGR